MQPHGRLKMKSLSKICLFVVVGISALGPAYAQDSAIFDVEEGAWKLYFQDADTQRWINRTYIQQNAIKPTISTSIAWSGDRFSYRYRVANARAAKQAIDTFRIWGIPSIYATPGLPPITADIKTETGLWTKQQFAQLEVKRQFQNEIIKAPKGWSANLRVDEKVNQSSFVWTPGLKDTDPSGINPGAQQGGYIVLRPELPGVARAKLTGSTDAPWGLDDLPDTPFWSQKIDEIQDRDFLLVAVLAPVIEVPVPYNSAELARRIRAHVQSWPKYGHTDAATLDRLNRQFDVLIPALVGNNKPAAQEAVFELFKEAFSHNGGLNHRKLDDDDEDRAAAPLARLFINPTVVEARAAMPSVQMDRIAARSLAFNLVYLLARLEK